MKTINTNKAPEALGPYSHAMVVNNLVFTSGQIPLDTEGNIVSSDVKEQTKQVLENLSVVLEEAVSDMNEFQQINEVYGSYFNEHQPARSCVEVSRLPKDVKVEIELVGKVKGI